jgi:hypothetical protein
MSDIDPIALENLKLEKLKKTILESTILDEQCQQDGGTIFEAILSKFPKIACIRRTNPRVKPAPAPASVQDLATDFQNLIPDLQQVIFDNMVQNNLDTIYNELYLETPNISKINELIKQSQIYKNIAKDKAYNIPNILITFENIELKSIYYNFYNFLKSFIEVIPDRFNNNANANNIILHDDFVVVTFTMNITQNTIFTILVYKRGIKLHRINSDTISSVEELQNNLIKRIPNQSGTINKITIHNIHPVFRSHINPVSRILARLPFFQQLRIKLLEREQLVGSAVTTVRTRNTPNLNASIKTFKMFEDQIYRVLYKLQQAFIKNQRLNQSLTFTALPIYITLSNFNNPNNPNNPVNNTFIQKITIKFQKDIDELVSYRLNPNLEELLQALNFTNIFYSVVNSYPRDQQILLLLKQDDENNAIAELDKLITAQADPAAPAGGKSKIFYKGYYYKIRKDGRRNVIKTLKEGLVSVNDVKKWKKLSHT